MAYQLPRLTARPGSFGRRAEASDFGAAEGAARAQGAGVIAELAAVSERILTAREGARASRALSEASLELEQQIEALRDDPDESTYESRFEEAQADIRGRYSKGLFGAWQGDFEERFEVAGAQAAGRVRDLVRAKRVSAGRADTEAALGNWANLYARSAEVDRPAVLEQAAELIGRGVGSGLYSAEQGQDALERLKAQATDGLWRAGKNQDPEGTLADLKASRGGFEHMNEPQRQVAIEAVEAEIAQRKQYDHARAQEARAAAERQQREAEESATKDGLFLVSEGKMTVDWVQQHRETLSPSAVSSFLEATRKQFNPAEIPDPAEYFRLRVMEAEDPRAFAAAPIDVARVGYNKALELVDARAKARSQDPVVTGQSFAGRLTERLKAMEGLDDLERSQLLRAGEARLQEVQEQGGKRPTPKEEQSIIDEVLLRHVSRTGRALGFIPFTGGTRVTEEPLQVQVEGVPTQHIEAIVDSLRRAGKPISPRSIRATYDEVVKLGLLK